MGEAPALSIVSKAYGPHVAESWLAIQLRDLSEFAGCREKLSTAQIDDISRVIISQWGYLKVTELMHFFVLFKSGKYGRFYGAVDGLVITEALHEFVRERYDLVCRFEHERRLAAEQAEAQRHKAEVDRFYAVLAVCNASPRQWYDISQQHALSLEEFEQIGWLLRT